MKDAGWIVCERSGHWAAALRMQLARPDSSSPARIRLHELREMSELSRRLDALPHSVALLEVTRRSFARVLDWLAVADRQFPHTRFAALIDSRSFPQNSAHDRSANDRQLLLEALWEAGATEIVTSLREIRQIADFGRRHFESLIQSAVPGAEKLPIADWAWASLPWQDA